MKVKIKTQLYRGKSLIYEFKNINAIYNEKEQKLLYNEPENKMKININKKKFKRDTKDLILELDEKTVTLYIKEIGDFLNVSLEKFNFIKKNNRIEIIYKINTEEENIKYIIDKEKE